MQILKFSLLFSLLFFMLACDDQQVIVVDESSSIPEPMIGEESLGSIHNRYLEDGLTFFCEHHTGDNQVENTLNTYDYMIQQFVTEYGFDQEQVENILAASDMGREDAVNFNPDILDEIIADSEYDQLWQTFEIEFVNVDNEDELEVLFQQLYDTYRDELDQEVIISFISITRSSYQYWDNYYTRWESCGQGVGRGPNDGGRRVIGADAGGAISGAINGAVAGAVLGVGVGAVPGAIGGAVLQATYSSLFAAITYLFW